MKTNKQKLKAKIKKMLKKDLTAFIDLKGREHLNNIHILLHGLGFKHNDSLAGFRGGNHIVDYNHYLITLRGVPQMGISLDLYHKDYMVINWLPSQGSDYEKDRTIKGF